jgi:hypothetical protein
VRGGAAPTARLQAEVGGRATDLEHLDCELEVAAQELIDAEAVERQRLPAHHLQLHADVVVPAARVRRMRGALGVQAHAGAAQCLSRT